MRSSVAYLLSMSRLHNFVAENNVLIMIENASEKRISVLNLSHCEISEIPLSLLMCNHFTKLHLNNNYLKILPEEISNWEHLKLLTLDYNLLTAIPSSIGKLKDLVCLNLSYNNLGHLIPEIGLLCKLEVLWLNHTYLESIPSEIGNCTELDTFGARGNFIRLLPPEMGKLKRLRWLTLEGNLLSNLPSEMNGLRHLVHLNLSNNRFSTIPKLDELEGLQYVFLRQNFITELFKIEMEKLHFIKKIYLQDNPIINITDYKNLRNVQFQTASIATIEEERDSDSDEWEESAPSSELDLSDSSEGEIALDTLTAALPGIAKFTSTGC